MTKRILIIGAIPYADRPESLGGVTVLMQNFLDYCAKHDLPYVHISANRFRKSAGSALWNSIYVFIFFLRHIFFCRTVMFNGTVNCAFRVYPLLAPIALLLRKKTVLRIFGGNYPALFAKQPAYIKKIVLYLLNRTDLIFGETSGVLEFFRSRISHPDRVSWFPNVRYPVKITRTGCYRKKMVFISRIIKSKGVDVILHVMKSLPKDYSVDFYGPFGDSDYTPEKLTTSTTSYKGILKPEMVQDTLRNYDLLLLPTFFQGEGYPGIIIEAFSLGIPVIAAIFGGIPEMFSNGEEGILIQPQSEKELYDAICSVTEESRQSMSKKALAAFNTKYNSESINPKIWEQISNL